MSDELKGIRIVSDGTVCGTKVFSADGEDLTTKLMIRGIEWKHNAGGIPVAVITSSLACVESTCDARHEEGLVDTSIHGDDTRSYHRISDVLGISEVEEVRHLTPSDGEILVLRFRDYLTDEARERIARAMQEKFPGVKAMVLDNGTEISIAKIQ